MLEAIHDFIYNNMGNADVSTGAIGAVLTFVGAPIAALGASKILKPKYVKVFLGWLDKIGVGAFLDGVGMAISAWLTKIFGKYGQSIEDMIQESLPMILDWVKKKIYFGMDKDDVRKNAKAGGNG